MPPCALPPWVPSPVALLAARDATGARRVHALTPLLFALSWVVAFASGNYERSWFAGGFFPLAALLVCVAVVPLAVAARWRVTARAAQAAYLGLASLAPWLVFAWPVSVSIDGDGDSGGALGGGVVLISSIFLLLVMPLTLAAFLGMPRWRVRGWPVAASATLVVGLALVAAAFSARHPAADGLARYTGEQATFEATGVPGRYVQSLGDATLRQRRVGERCVTHLIPRFQQVRPYLAHRCASPVWVHQFPGTRARGLFERPLYSEMVFASAEGRVIGNKAAPRYLLFTAPLWEWIVGALVGVALGLFTLRRTRATLAALRALPTREGTARDGTARCDDGTVVQLPDALAGHSGRVVVLGDPTQVAPFREVSREGVIVLAGSRRWWDEALDESESVAMSFALAVTWLPAAPLLASPFLGMLSPLP